MNLLLKAFINGPLLLLTGLAVFVGAVVGLYWGISHHPAFTLGAVGGTILFAMFATSWAEAYEDLKTPKRRRGIWD